MTSYSTNSIYDHPFYRNYKKKLIAKERGFARWRYKRKRSFGIIPEETVYEEALAQEVDIVDELRFESHQINVRHIR